MICSDLSKMGNEDSAKKNQQMPKCKNDFFFSLALQIVKYHLHGSAIGNVASYVSMSVLAVFCAEKTLSILWSNVHYNRIKCFGKKDFLKVTMKSFFAFPLSFWTKIEFVTNLNNSKIKEKYFSFSLVFLHYHTMSSSCT